MKSAYITYMKTRTLWNGVRMRTLQAAADPDAPLYSVTIPADWDDDSASALIQLCPKAELDHTPVRMDHIAMTWLKPLCESTEKFTLEDWARLLLFRQTAPNLSIWTQENSQKPGFVVNLAAFASADNGFDAKAYYQALKIVADSIRLLAHQQLSYQNGELPFLEALPPAEQQGKLFQSDKDLNQETPVTAGMIQLTNLDACLAQLGLDYDSDKGRDVACCLAAFATLLANVGCGTQYLPLTPDWSALPELMPLAKELWVLASVEPTSPLLRVETGFSSPGPVDALLGVESCGLAPIFSPIRNDGRLAVSTLARLAYKGLTLEAAFASALAGEKVLSQPDIKAHYAMHQALAGFVTHMPPRPNPITAPLSPKATLPRGVRQPLPMRRKGITQKASIAGRGLFLRTGEYEDGSLGEVFLTPVRENAMVRGLMEGLAQAVSIGLQYGAPLEDYVSAFAYSHFGVAGTVEGDPGALYATSFLDYSFRALSDIYLKRHLPDSPNNLTSSHEQDIPMLPLDLPAEESNDSVSSSSSSGRRNLKLVS